MPPLAARVAVLTAAFCERVLRIVELGIGLERVREQRAGGLALAGGGSGTRASSSLIGGVVADRGGAPASSSRRASAVLPSRAQRTAEVAACARDAGIRGTLVQQRHGAVGLAGVEVHQAEEMLRFQCRRAWSLAPLAGALRAVSRPSVRDAQHRLHLGQLGARRRATPRAAELLRVDHALDVRHALLRDGCDSM